VNLPHLKAIRDQELDRVLELFPPRGRVLEVGSGAGWQAKRLAAKGYQVTALDVPASNYAHVRVYPTALYDGEHIPIAEDSFDVVFSSNVLEHVENLVTLSVELRRVLKPGGLAIHVLPTPSWRFWTICTHYVAVLRQYRGRDMLRSLWQARHGVRGNLFTEMYFFSRLYWEAQFSKLGWEVLKYSPNHLFYTGYSILDFRMTIPQRTNVASFLGSSCGIFVLRDRARLLREAGPMVHSRITAQDQLPGGASNTAVRRVGALAGNAVLIATLLMLLFQLRVLWGRALTADNAMRSTIYSMGDDFEYQMLAVNLLRGRGFTEAIIGPLADYHLDLTSSFGEVIVEQYEKTGTYLGLTFYRTPGFPLVLSMAYAIFGLKTAVARLLLAMLAWLTSILLLLIGRFSGGPMNWVAGSIVALGFLYHPMIDLQRTLTEIPATFWITLFALLYMLYLRRSQRWLLVCASVAYAGAVYTRSLFLTSLPLLMAYEYGRRRQYQPLLIVGAIVLLPVAAWSIYASAAAGKIIPFTTQSEIAFPQYNNIDVLEGVGPNHFMQGGWNPGWLQDKQGVWHSDYRYAPQPGENGWVKGLTFWRQHYLQLPALFFVKLRTGLWFDNGGDSLAAVFLASIGALLLAIGLRPQPPKSRLRSALMARYAILCQLALLFLLLSDVLPFATVLLIVWPLMLLISLLWPYGDLVGSIDPVPVWFLALVVGHAVVTLVFGGEPRFHQPLDALLVLFGFIITITTVRYLFNRLRSGPILAPA
jgi:SAM-dependent methyltransferase